MSDKTDKNEKSDKKVILQAKGKEVEKLEEAKEMLSTLEQILLLILQSPWLKKILEFFNKFFPKLKTASIDLKNLESKISSIFAILARLLTVITATALLFSSLNGVLDTSYIIEPFKVPAKLVEDGMDGTVFSGRLMRKIDEIITSIRNVELSRKTDGQQDEFVTKIEYNFNKNISNDDVIIMGISMNSVKKIIRTAFNLENKQISGSIIKNAESLELILDVTGWKKAETIHVSENKEDSLDRLIRDTAILILKKNDPKIIIVYYISQREFVSATQLILDTIANPEYEKEKGEMYYFLGLINLIKNTNLNESIKYFYKAEDLHFASDKLYLAWGDAHFNLQEDENARIQYEKAIKLNPKNPEAYSKAGKVYKWIGKPELALEYCKKSLSLENTENYRAISTIVLASYDLEKYEDVISFSRTLDFKILNEYYTYVLLLYLDSLLQTGKLDEILEVKQSHSIDSNVLLHKDLDIFTKLELALLDKENNKDYWQNAKKFYGEVSTENKSEKLEILKALISFYSQNETELKDILVDNPTLEPFQTLILNLYSEPKKVENLIELANAFYKSGQFTIANHFYKKILVLDDKNFVANLRLCDSEKKPNSTSVYCKNALQLKPDSPLLNLQMAKSYYKKKNFKEAISLAQKSIIADQEEIKNQSFLLLGSSYFAIGDKSKAKENFLNYKFKSDFYSFPDAIEFYKNLSMKEVLEYKESFKNLFPKEEFQFSDSFYLAFILDKVGRKDESLLEYKNSLQESSSNPKNLIIINYRIAKLLASQKKFSEAAIYYNIVIANVSAMMDYLDYINYAEAYKGKKSIGALKKALSLVSAESKWIVNLKLGKLFYEMRDYQNSYFYLSEFYEYIKVNNLLGTINSIVKSNSSDFDFFGYYLKSSIISGDLKKAKEIIKKMLVESPDNPRLYKGIGLFYEKNGDKEKAILSYEKAIELNPQPEPNYPRTLPYFELGRLYSDLGEIDKSILNFKKSLSQYPEDKEVLQGLIQVLKKTNKKEEVAKYQKALFQIEIKTKLE